MFSISITTSRRAVFDAAGLVRQVQQLQNDHNQRLIQRAKKYPPERPNQKYVRTYKLRDGWKSKPSRLVGGRLESEVYNEMPYANWVYGTDDEGTGQSAYHVGRWPTRGMLAARDSYRADVQHLVETFARRSMGESMSFI